MKTWLLAVVASVGLLSGCGAPMDGEADEQGTPATEEVAGGEVTQAACPDPIACYCARTCNRTCGGVINPCYDQCVFECL
ncbi:hypothetical protein JY651_16450 [Pyxidicoccus parkwayensis]|uniref:Lipoprotein n=1 Tax=Pyxidicoccus parkwayensis TaxID=2813578 RepID=A0ABX7P7I8_9BACT|nr:hypothetical protein [Pyxidicoccus parkwaysis]QSQ26417.1 hypothetical protein JY651_16450 [Pyxidicoccus parkwaysis]